MLDARHQIRVLGKGSGDALDMMMAHRLGDGAGVECAIQRLLERLGVPQEAGARKEADDLRRDLVRLRESLRREALLAVRGIEALAARLCRYFAMEDVRRAGDCFEAGQFQLSALLLEVASDEALQAMDLEEGRHRDRKAGVLIHEARTVASSVLARDRTAGVLRPTIDTLRLVLESMARVALVGIIGA